MCGITGYIDFKKESSIEILNAMTDTLKHRGPDGEGKEEIFTQDAQIGFGHRRLAIIDLTDTGKQPMSYDNNWICYNGEIYNYKEVKAELTALKHTFKGDSDTEVILHAYAEWGAGCVQKFIGMFSFALYDYDKHQVIFMRDRAGVKPLFYYYHDGLFMFASELKAFHSHPGFKKELNKDAVAAFMQYGNVPTPHCIFNYCAKVRPGHFIRLNLDTKEVSEHQYWNLYTAYNQPKWEITYEEAKEKTKELLKSAFEYRMVADVPVGIFLSGGFDSTCVAAILQEGQKEKLKTFTIAVPDLGLNEGPYAKDIARHLGTDHTEITCTQKEAIDLIRDLPYFYDEPFADSSAIPTTLVSKMARKDVTVALSADAGDEIFAGYNRYDYLIRYRNKLKGIPGFMRHGIAGLMNTIPSRHIPVLKDKYNFHNRYEKLKQILRDPSDEKVMLSLSQQYTDEQMGNMMTGRTEPLQTYYQSAELQSEFYSPLTFMMAIDYQTYLVDDILQKVDRATMSVSLEGREPFLDHRIIEFAARLPNEFKYHEGVKKRILRDIVYDYVPKDLMDRPKMGFAIPIAEWLMNDLRPMVEEYCSEDRLNDHDLFNQDIIKKLLSDFYGGKKEYDMKVWYLLMFQMWYEKWMEG